MLSRSAIGWLAAAALLVVTVVDGGSVLLTEMSVPDDTTTAGHAAAGAVEDERVSQQAAITAFEAARSTAAGDLLEVRSRSFRLFPDGEVTLTASRTAPTLVMHRIPFLRDLTVVTSTVTVGPLPYH